MELQSCLVNLAVEDATAVSFLQGAAEGFHENYFFLHIKYA